jgi:DNA-binding response OmpR family regulator
LLLSATIRNEPATKPRTWRLLFVDDDAVSLRAYAQLFGAPDMKSPPRSTSPKPAATAHTFDFVICDLGLPDGSGLDLMPELRERYGLRGIALSGYRDGEHRQQAGNEGFVDYLVKPVDIEDIVRPDSDLCTPNYKPDLNFRKAKRLGAELL